MIEVIKLIKELRGYPENSFAYPQSEAPDTVWLNSNTGTKGGLVIVDLDGDQLGFIETGGEGKVIIK